MKCVNIPLFVPHCGCPHDCVFCNQKRITANTTPVDGVAVDGIIKEHLKTITGKPHIEAAFFGGSFTGIPMNVQDSLLSVAQNYLDAGKIDGIRLSTRPDYISTEILDLLKLRGVTTIELGVQSMDKEVLKNSNRGHDISDVYKSSALIKDYGFSLGLQMMTGLPGDTDDKSMQTAESFISLTPDFVRIYPTLVIKDTTLADMYCSGAYTPQPLDEAVRLCKRLKMRFLENGIQVIRVSLQPTEEISPDASVIAGPYHSAFGELVDNEIYYDLIAQKTNDLRNCSITLGVNRSEISKVVGNGKRNKIRLLREKNIRMRVIGIDIDEKKIELMGVE